MKQNKSLFVLAAVAFIVLSLVNVAGKLFQPAIDIASMVKPALLPTLAIATLAALGDIKRKGVALLVAAQLAGCLGDILLLRGEFPFFAGGIAAFLTGHICYITLFKKSYKGLKPWQWAIAIACMAVLVVALILVIGIKGAMLGPMAVYGSALSFLILTGALGVIRKLGPAWTFILIGAVLFTFSDAQIAMDTFGKSYPGQPFVIMFTYLLAQALLAIGSIKLLKADA